MYLTDNLSADSTRDLVRPFEKGGQVTVIEEHDDDYAQSKWVTRMARQAHADGADWVINCDADEFWWSSWGPDLRSIFGVLGADVGVVLADRSDFPPIEQRTKEPFWEVMVYRKNESLNALGRPLPPKAAHRAASDVVVAQGNHAVDGLEHLDRVRDGRLQILHFPVRSERQFTQKIVNGGAAYARNEFLDPEVGSTWRTLYAEYLERGLWDRYSNEAMDIEGVDDLVASGDLVLDLRLRDRLRCLGGHLC